MKSFLWLCACVSLFQGGELEPLRVEDFVRTGVTYLGLANPEPLLREDVERWAAILNASAEQIHFMQIQYEQFVTRHNEFLKHEVGPYLDLSAAAGNSYKSGGPFNSQHLDQMRKRAASTRRLLVGLEGVENDYIDSISQALTGDQLDLLYILRNEASRRQSRCSPQTARWAAMELRLVWEKLDPENMPPEDREMMDVLLADYETRVTPLLRRIANMQWSLSLEQAELFNRHAAGEIDGESLRAGINHLKAKHASVIERVSEITAATVRLASESLTPPVAHEFQTRAKAAAFPELYPDRDSLIPLFEALCSSPDLDESVKETTDSLRMLYEAEYSRMCTELEDQIIHWTTQSKRGVSGYETQFMRSALQPNLARRRELSTVWMERLNTTFGKELVQSHMVKLPACSLEPVRDRSNSAGSGRPPLPLKELPPRPKPSN